MVVQLTEVTVGREGSALVHHPFERILAIAGMAPSRARVVIMVGGAPSRQTQYTLGNASPID